MSVNASDMHFVGDFSTNDFSQWIMSGVGTAGGLQDSTRNKDTTTCHFGPLTLLPSGRSILPVTVGQFRVPASPTVKQRCQVVSDNAPIRVDVDDFITLRLYVDPNWTDGSPQWPIQIIEPNFQALGPNKINQFTLIVKDTYVGVQIHTGIANKTGNPYWYEYISDPSKPANASNVPFMYAIPIGAFTKGVWHEIIVNIRWKFDKTGRIKTWHREFGTKAWTQTANQTGFPTLQRNPDGTYGKITQADVLQLYRGAAKSPTTLYMQGYTRSGSMVTARAYLDAIT